MSTKQEYYALKGMITELPAERQENITKTSYQLRQIIKDAGEDGLLAMALVGMEVSEELG